VSDEAPPALLHSLREFSELVMPCVEAVAPRRILEIGSEAGGFTQDLCEWAAEHGASVTSVEPFPLALHHRLVEEYGLNLIEGKSPGALDGLGDFDLCVLDGDHNYWVVSQELRRVFAGGASPLAIAHDVAWPCARRDQYYDPADIPDEHRQPFSYDGGVRPGHEGLVRGGFRGEGQFAYAASEGGPNNGVLTAVEDFLAQRPDLEFLRVPCIFGLGFIFPRAAPWADRVRQIVGPLHESTLLAVLERNRIELFLHFIDPLGGAQRLAHAPRGLLDSMQREIEALQAEVAHLRLTLAEEQPSTPTAG
jgi:hypothetical protein